MVSHNSAQQALGQLIINNIYMTAEKREGVGMPGSELGWVSWRGSLGSRRGCHLFLQLQLWLHNHTTAHGSRVCFFTSVLHPLTLIL